MTPPDVPDYDPEAPGQIYTGRRYPFAMAPEWVQLAIDPATGKRISAHSRAMYNTLMMHRNLGRGDNVVYPGTEALAELAGLSRADKVKAHIDPLVRINAVEVHVYRWGERAEKSRNDYLLHETPPPGYTGFTSLAEFYAARAEHLAELAEAERGRGERSERGAPPLRAPGASRQNPRPDSRNRRSAPEPLKRGGPASPKKGSPAPPKTGHQPQQPQLLEEQEELQEEEAARARADETPQPDQNSTTPETEAEELAPPTLFALITIRQIIDEAPHTTGRGPSGRPETIGENEVYELARAFDAEAERLTTAGVSEFMAGGTLSAWLSRGLETAKSLYAVLRARLKPGHASTRITRRKRPQRAPQAPEAPPEPKPEPAPERCTVHAGATPGHCARCEQDRQAQREERKRKVHSAADLARANIARTRRGSEQPHGVDA